jgi:hypothetical protein
VKQGEVIVIMAETKQRACRAEDKSKCRFHRSEVFAEDATTMYAETSYSKVSPTVGAYVKALAEKAFERLNEEMQNKDVGLDDAPQFRNRILSVMRQVHDEVPASGNTRSNFSPARLAEAGYFQFQRTVKSDRSKSDVNVLEADNVAPFDRSAAAMISKEGKWVTPFDDGFYGSWAHAMGTNHIRKCGPSFVGVPVEDEWDFFAGTFADLEDGIEHGMKAEVECNCGALKGEMRVTGDFTDLTRKLVNEYS